MHCYVSCQPVSEQFRKEISIHDLAVLVSNITGSDSEIVLVPFEEAYAPGFEDMRRRLPDIAKIQKLIGYRPTLDLPDMLERIVAYYRARLGEPAVA